MLNIPSSVPWCVACLLGLDGLAAASKQAKNERPAKYAELESKLKVPQAIHLACEFVEKSRQRLMQKLLHSDPIQWSLVNY